MATEYPENVNSLSTINENDARMAGSLRLDTFRNWKSEISIQPAKMADAGFSYTNNKDIVKCHYCGIEKGDWKEGDIPLDIHKLQSPNCRFLQENDVENEAAVAMLSCSQPNQEKRISCQNLDELRKENEKLRNEMTCKMCQVEQKQTLFLPCRHLIVCELCAEKLDVCFLCQSKILGTVRTILAQKKSN